MSCPTSSEHLPTAHRSHHRSHKSEQPLINSARNAPVRLEQFEYEQPPPSKNSVFSARRLRSYLVAYLALLLVCGLTWFGFVGPRWREQGELAKALDGKNKNRPGTSFGSNPVAKFEDLHQLKTLDGQFLPHGDDQRRLVIIGDVHGCQDELESLLEQISFRSQTDHLILAGDLINKGPKSVGVIKLARKYQASCVRGNHEDRILLDRRRLISNEKLLGPDKAQLDIEADGHPEGGEEEDEEGDKEGVDTSSKKILKNRHLARALSDDDAVWLQRCPVILKVGQIGSMGEVVVVHGGLLPGLKLEKQDPLSVMTMRTLDADTHTPSSKRRGLDWSKVFNKYQTAVVAGKSTTDATDPLPTTVFYGHTPRSSPKIREYTKGLDTGCVKGGKMTAFVIEAGGKTKIEQVKCRNYLS